MTDQPLDLAGVNIGSLKTEIDAGLSSLISALTFAEKFAVFLPENLKTELVTAVSVLTSIKALVDKFA